jgi:hypothetical protein
MLAFRHLIGHLARIFEDTTHKRATITRDHYRTSGYGGRFWNFAEIVRPIVVAIIEASGTVPLGQPATDFSRGKFIEVVLKKIRTEKSSVRSS